MRPVYLGITGYLVGYLGQQRLELQEQMRQLEGAPSSAIGLHASCMMGMRKPWRESIWA